MNDSIVSDFLNILVFFFFCCFFLGKESKRIEGLMKYRNFFEGEFKVLF